MSSGQASARCPGPLDVPSTTLLPQSNKTNLLAQSNSSDVVYDSKNEPGELDTSVQVCHSSEAEGFGAKAITRPTVDVDNRGCVNKESLRRAETRDGVFGALRLSKTTDWDHPMYDVEDLYSKAGIFQAVARSDSFQHLCTLVIAANAIYIGVETDYNNARTLFEASPVFIVFENFFCLFFSLEVFVRFCSFKIKCNCLQDAWFKLDSALVVGMMLDTWVMPVVTTLTTLDAGNGWAGLLRLLRLIRIFRLARFARLIRMFPSLITLVKALGSALGAVLSSLMLLLFITYVFGIIIKPVIGEVSNIEEELPGVYEYFQSVPDCMWTLLLDGTFMDDTGARVRPLMDYGSPMSVSAAICFIIFIFLSAVMLMNMLIGVICEMVSQASVTERNDHAIMALRKDVLSELQKFDVNGDSMISAPELQTVLTNSKSLRTLGDFGVDLEDFSTAQDMLFCNRREIPIFKVMELMMSARKDNGVTFHHLAEGLAQSRWVLMNALQDHAAQMDRRLHNMEDILQAPTRINNL
eukprot:NODE_2339_length_2232_cov_9.614252.p1 GENE.NODE_2339_length_2232_cov_9.614252~~NODE_2339_length_2232_cov_9.614252.p1  ORF type:complete len:524 (+),score=90.93 NODE_2339_length_2232_cov_9.614252:404-1975(+)